MTTGIFVTARMGSTRLREKHFLDVGGSRALDLLVGRLEREFARELADGRAVLAIATGNEGDNARFGEIAGRTAARVFHGDDHNVPLRHLQAARQLGVDAIVSVDGDDVFVAPEALRFVHDALAAGAPLARTRGLPLGMNAWGYGTASLAAALDRANASTLETGWGRIFDGVEAVESDMACPGADDVRATLDYAKDLEFFDACVRAIPDWAGLASGEFVRRIVDLGLHRINGQLNEEYWRNFNMNIGNETLASSNEAYSARLHAVIPGGAHTYSRGDDQYPANAPRILERGKGAYVWSPDGRKFLDYGMALRAVSIGYSEPEINEAAIRGLELGNGLTRASVIELEAAEKLVSLVDSVDMVKFTKNGSTATSAAVKLARAFTGKDLVARCAQHPFFSYDDWFIGSTPITRGIPSNTIEQTKTFNYNDIASLERLIAQYPDQFACVILEPAATDCPATPAAPAGDFSRAIQPRNLEQPANYLQQVEALCRRHGIVFILDEMITGFRWDLKGAQHVYGVSPDLCTFGKSMANGFSVAAVAGRRELMELGSIDKAGQERLFLLSTTHGAEMSGLAAFLAATAFLERHAVIDHLWSYGAELIAMFNRVAAEHGIERHLKAAGPAPNPYYMTTDASGKPWMELRTLFSQEMIRRGVLMPWMAFSYRHGEDELRQTHEALQHAAAVCAKAIAEGVDQYLEGPAIKPVFRRFN
jgi:glutamate-1-semialdehyde 2,1-aminomutase